MHFNEHCRRVKKRLGEDFAHVHRWLDEFYGHWRYKTKHRKLRHHWGGIEEVRRMWGDRAAQAAAIHILDDLRSGEDASLEESDIPKDKEEYVRRGYW